MRVKRTKNIYDRITVNLFDCMVFFMSYIGIHQVLLLLLYICIISEFAVLTNYEHFFFYYTQVFNLYVLIYYLFILLIEKEIEEN